MLLDDCFTNYHDPGVAIAATRVLESAGYAVELAGLACCGRPAISKGMLGLARELASANVERLAAVAGEGVPILALEPSCAAALVDEYREFRLGPAADRVASRVQMADAFLAGQVTHWDLSERSERILVHGHCHQKAVLGVRGTVELLRLLPGAEVVELDAGCCGMAGSFGYERGHYDVSKALAERVLLPAVRAAQGATLAAPGFSCRGQVHDLAGVVARHPLEILADRLPVVGLRRRA